MMRLGPIWRTSSGTRIASPGESIAGIVSCPGLYPGTMPPPAYSAILGTVGNVSDKPIFEATVSTRDFRPLV